MFNSLGSSRRDFLRSSLIGLAGLATVPLGRAVTSAADAPITASKTARVSVTAGPERAENVFRGLTLLRKEIGQAIGNRRVVIKPNNVSIDVQLCATHADCLEATLEFLKSIGKLEHTVIAESAASGPTLDGFSNYGYNRVADKYHVELVDLDQQPIQALHIFDEKDFRPHRVRMAQLLLDPNTFIISAAKMKTHDRVVATLSLKNIIVGAPIKDPGFRWGPGGKRGAKNDKPIIHGSGFRGINYNLFAIAQQLHPHLAIIDGYDGMQGNGPVGGTAVDHKVAVASLDWLAADRVALELMGIDYAKVGYLNFCAQAGLGEGDLARIEVLGELIAEHVKPYKLHDNIEQQLIWTKPVA